MKRPKIYQRREGADEKWPDLVIVRQYDGCFSGPFKVKTCDSNGQPQKGARWKSMSEKTFRKTYKLYRPAVAQ
jgi:hypothetical protein